LRIKLIPVWQISGVHWRNSAALNVNSQVHLRMTWTSTVIQLNPQLRINISDYSSGVTVEHKKWVNLSEHPPNHKTHIYLLFTKTFSVLVYFCQFSLAHIIGYEWVRINKVLQGCSLKVQVLSV
jgi:hypothetical protein